MPLMPRTTGLSRTRKALSAPPSIYDDCRSDGLQLKRVVGRGSYGTVWLAEQHPTKKMFAVKHIHRVFDARRDTVRVLREVRLLRELRHPNLVALQKLMCPVNTSTFNDIFVVLELLDTDLAQMINSATVYDLSHRRWVLFQLLRGLSHIHAAGVVHRDIKPANILINASCDCKICDLGLARVQREPEKNGLRRLTWSVDATQQDQGDGEDDVVWSDYVASRWYRAPELIACERDRAKYTSKIDLWSVGCIAAELLTQTVAFPGKSNSQQLTLITDTLGLSAEDIAELDSRSVRKTLLARGTKKKLSLNPLLSCRGADTEEVGLIERLLVFSPSRRFSADQAISHPLFAIIADNPAAQIAHTDIPDLMSDPAASFVSDRKQPPSPPPSPRTHPAHI